MGFFGELVQPGVRTEFVLRSLGARLRGGQERPKRVKRHGEEGQPGAPALMGTNSHAMNDSLNDDLTLAYFGRDAVTPGTLVVQRTRLYFRRVRTLSIPSKPVGRSLERNAPKAGLRTLPTITASEIEASICRLGLGCAVRPMPSIHGP